jgi:hypothetical protein
LRESVMLASFVKRQRQLSTLPKIEYVTLITLGGIQFRRFAIFSGAVLMRMLYAITREQAMADFKAQWLS